MNSQHRLIRTHQQTINASPERVFPLLCPVREREWLPGWTCRMVHSNSGWAEPGAVFTTSGERGETVWLLSEQVAPRRVAFVRFEPERVVVWCEIELAALAGGRTRVAITYTYTALDAAGEQALAAQTEAGWQQMQACWESSMNDWLEAHPEWASS